jgi:hypothetical protein
MIKIEKDVPVPKNITRKSKYPFREMKIGDSFFVKDKEDIKKTQRKMAAVAYMFCKKNSEYKFKTQALEAGVRVWRVK